MHLIGWQKPIISSALIISAFFLFTLPLLAAETCCLCTKYDGTQQEFPNIAEGDCKNKSTTPTGEVGFATSCAYYPKSCATVKAEEQAEREKHLIKPAPEKETKFTPIEPKLQIPIPTIQFTKATKEGDLIDLPWLAEYIAGVFKYAVAIISIVAIVMIMVGGLKWLTAGGNAAQITSAKETISGAVIGLILALGSYTVLYVINPELVSFKSLRIKLIETERLVANFGSEEAVVPIEDLPTGTGSLANMRASCSPAGTLDALKNVVSVWVNEGTAGGAIYVRGGMTTKNGCTSFSAQESWLKNHFTKNGVDFNQNSSSGELLNLYKQKISVFKDKVCGDCNSWLHQLLKCAGKKISLTALGSSCISPTCIEVQNKSCGEAAKQMGGAKFGDVFKYRNDKYNFTHWFIYTGGAGLPYEIAEMGGQSGKGTNCGKTPYGNNYNNCVGKVTKKENYAAWKNSETYCRIYRLFTN